MIKWIRKYKTQKKFLLKKFRVKLLNFKNRFFK